VTCVSVLQLFQDMFAGISEKTWLQSKSQRAKRKRKDLEPASNIDDGGEIVERELKSQRRELHRSASTNSQTGRSDKKTAQSSATKVGGGVQRR
jgi:hypothetical protein